MKTVGSILKEARLEKRISLERLENETKIKKEFIARIENGSWNRLPTFPVVLGFVKNIASALEVDIEKALALLRRDYPPKKTSFMPEKEVERKFVWGPRLTFALGVFVIVIFVLGYLAFQYISFIRPPELVIFEPEDGKAVSALAVKVRGRTNPEATVKVNNQPLLLDGVGGFDVNLEITDKTTELVFVAQSRNGKTTEVRRRIQYRK